MTATESPPKYLTIAQIAERLAVERHQVKWILVSRRIGHQVEVGDQKGYSEAAILEIRAAIEGIAAKY